MSVEILFILMLCGITVLAYMIAINAHGAVRLSISYLFATLLLAGSVYCIVEQVNAKADKETLSALKRAEQAEIEKQKAEELLRKKDESLQSSRERTVFLNQLTAIITSGSTLANRVKNVELRNSSVDLDALLGQANGAKKKSAEIKADFKKLDFYSGFYPEVVPVVREALEQTVDACRYYSSFYHSEDAVQERERERIMRSKAQAASAQFENANQLLARSR
jgi:nucleoside diphosphate kinase